MGDLAVAAQVNPVANGLDSFSKVLGIQKQRQDLQTGQAIQQQHKNAAAMSSQEVAEMQAAIPLMRDPEGSGLIRKNEQGQYVPTENAYSAIKRAMPMYGDKHYGDMMDAMNHNLTFRDSYRKLTEGQTDTVRSTVGGVLADPNATMLDVDNSLNDLESRYKGTPNEADISKVTELTRNALKHAQTPNPLDPNKDKPDPTDGKLPDRVRQVGMAHVRGGLGADQQAGPQGMLTEKPASINTGAATLSGTQAPAVLGGGFTPKSETKNAIPPGFVLVTDSATGNHYYLNPQTNQSMPAGSGTAPHSGAAPNAGATPMAPPQRQIGEAPAQAAQAQTNFGNYQATVKAAQDAPQQRDQIHKAIGILGTGVSTSTGAAPIAETERVLAQIPGLEGIAGPSSKAAKLDLLNKYLDRIASQFGALTGSPNDTDASAAHLRDQIGHTGYTNAALAEVLKYTDSQYSAAQAKDRAQQKFISGGGTILNQHDFEQKWRSAYDPQVFQLASESPADQHKILADMKKNSPADYAKFVSKYRTLKAMGADPQ